MSPQYCHTRGAGEPWNGGLFRVALLATALLALGCADGYPTEDVPSAHPAEMSQAQRLTMMNELGSRPHLPQRWTYKLADGCQLTIGKGNRSAVVVPLKGASIKSSTGEAGRTFSVLLIPPDRPPSEAVEALDGAKWFDLVQMRSLVDQVQRAC